MKKQLLYLFMALLGGAIGGGAIQGYLNADIKASAHPTQVQTEAQPSNPVPAQTVSYAGLENAPNFRLAAERSLDAVVHIKTEFTHAYYNDPWSYFFGGRPQEMPIQSSGSGVIVTDDGFILTNHHVIKDAERIAVVLNDGSTVDAEVVGKDPLTDLALLKVDRTDLPFIPFGDSDQIQVGDWVLAVGNPFNLTSTVTAGIVSAKARNINLLKADPYSQVFPIESFIQTDAAVNPGNSGGALVSSDGLLVGINTAIASKTGSYSGYSFAVPVNIAKKVFHDLYEFGKVQRAFIGVNIQDINGANREEYDLNTDKGVLIVGLSELGAAEKAKLEKGDVILAVNGVEVENVTQLQEQIGRYRPGDEVELKLMRNKRHFNRKVTLTNKAGTTELESASLPVETAIVLGAELEKLPPEKLQKWGLKSGVQVKKLHRGPLTQLGVPEGFIITRIDRLEVHEPHQVKEILESRKGGILIEGYTAKGKKGYFALGL